MQDSSNEEEAASFERARAQLAEFGLAERIRVFPVSSATVSLAAQALGCEQSRIAKTLSFKAARFSRTVLLVTAGDARVDNTKFRAEFGSRPKMLSAEEVKRATGHAPGGVCPFGIHNTTATEVAVVVDVSLQRFEHVFPAAGTHNSGVKLTPEELFRAARAERWVDVCSAWRTEEERSSPSS